MPPEHHTHGPTAPAGGDGGRAKKQAQCALVANVCALLGGVGAPSSSRRGCSIWKSTPMSGTRIWQTSTRARRNRSMARREQERGCDRERRNCRPQRRLLLSASDRQASRGITNKHCQRLAVGETKARPCGEKACARLLWLVIGRAAQALWRPRTRAMVWWHRSNCSSQMHPAVGHDSSCSSPASRERPRWRLTTR